MTVTDYLKYNTTPRVGGVIWSPHSTIIKRGYGLVHKIIAVRRKKRDGKLVFWVTVKTTTPSKKVLHKSQSLWLDEVD